MRLKSIGVLRGYAMGKTQLNKIADDIEREVEEALESERSENAKLRELCRDLRFCRGNDCLTCSHGRFCELRLNERCDELGVV